MSGQPHYSLPDAVRALRGVPGSPLGTLVGAFADEAGIGFDELTGLTESVLTLDQHGAAALAVHGEDAAMLLTLCQQTIAFLTLTQAFTVHALTKATAEQRLTVEHGPGATPSASARGRAAGRARTAVVGEAVASCGFDPAQRALVSHLAGMDADRTQVAARLLAQGVLTGPMVAMLLSRRTEHLTDSQVAWLTRRCADLTHPTTNDHHNSDSRDSTDSTDRDSNVSDDGAGAGACETGVHRDDTAAAPAGSEGEGGRLRLVGSLSRRERVALARRQAFAEACDWTDADWVDPDTAVPSWAVFRDRFDQGLAWLLADDPDIAGDYETGMAARCVSSRLDPEGTGSLTVTGDGVAVAAARNRVHRLARRLRQLGDERTVAQIAADLTLTLLTHGYVTCPHCGHTITTTPTNDSSGSTASSTGQVADGGPAGGCGGVHDDRADGGGCDGSSGSQAAAGGRAGACAGVHDGADEGGGAPEPAGDTTAEPASAGPGPEDARPAGSPPAASAGQSSAGSGADGGLDVLLPYPDLPEDRTPPLDEGLGKAVADGLAPPAVTVHVTVSLETLLGMTQLPARMDSGPVRAWIPARQARALALTLGGTWQRIVTDPATGVALNTAVRSYQPGPATRAHLVMLDNGCRAPGCTTRHDLQLDHLTPHAAGGPTSGDNLHTLDAHHHQHKTTGTWHATPEHDQGDDGHRDRRDGHGDGQQGSGSSSGSGAGSSSDAGSDSGDGSLTDWPGRRVTWTFPSGRQTTTSPHPYPRPEHLTPPPKGCLDRYAELNEYERGLVEQAYDPCLPFPRQPAAPWNPTQPGSSGPATGHLPTAPRDHDTTAGATEGEDKNVTATQAQAQATQQTAAQPAAAQTGPTCWTEHDYPEQPPF